MYSRTATTILQNQQNSVIKIANFTIYYLVDAMKHTVVHSTSLYFVPQVAKLFESIC